MRRQWRGHLQAIGEPECWADICTYIADFFYIPRGKLAVYEDAKGMKTPIYRLKKKLVKACTGIEIVEV